MQTCVFDRNTTACFTGHRTVFPADLSQLKKKTAEAVLRSYAAGYRIFLCGGARGFDTIAALEVLRLRADYPDIRLIIAVPCATQPDRWAAEDRAVYRKILHQADDVRILSETYYDGCMQNRNRFMVDHSSLVLSFLVRFEGGTWSTVRYAMHQGVAVQNLAMRLERSPVLKEKSWNYISISHFVYKNVSIVRLYPSLLRYRRWKNTLLSFSGK